MITGQAFAASPSVTFFNSYFYQGDTLLGIVSNGTATPVSASFDNRNFSILNLNGSYRVLGGIQASERTGYHALSIKFSDGTAFQKSIYVSARKFLVVDLGLPEKLGVTPSQLVKNLETEKSNLNSIVAVKTDKAFSHNFGFPLADNRRIVAPYGEIRKSGEQLIRHLGTDFGSPKGSVVAAINDGIVRKAGDDPVYGNTVIVDHGAGIFSLYMHLDSIKAKIGQPVKYGQIVGTVGETGYATGPHLHLSIKINTVSVDPIKFVKILKSL